MHELYELKSLLCEELEEYGRKGEVSASSLDVIDKLSHAIKNLDKIIESKEDGGYSSRYYDDGRSYNRGMSYARRRDSRGRYSRDTEMISELRELMQDAPNEHVKKEFERFISKVENM